MYQNHKLGDKVMVKNLFTNMCNCVSEIVEINKIDYKLELLYTRRKIRALRSEIQSINDSI